MRITIKTIKTAVEKYKNPIVICGDFNTMVSEPLYRQIRKNWYSDYHYSTFPNLKNIGFLSFFSLDYMFIHGNIQFVKLEKFEGLGSDHDGSRAELKF